MSVFNLFGNIKSTAPEPHEPVSFIIVGLGNDGARYMDTRHNAGFMAIDTLAKKYNTVIKKFKFRSHCADVDIAGRRCLLMKPLTLMNRSGLAVVEALNFYKVPIENVIVLCDDITITPPRIRIKRNGSDGGHNGLKNIIYLTGTDNFPRIKIGVGDKPHPDYDLADWVLSRFTANEIPLIKDACENACRSIELIVNDQIEKAMNEYNIKS